MARPLRPHLSQGRLDLHLAAGEWPREGPSAALSRLAREAPGHLLFIDGADRVSAGELERRAVALSAGLRSLGIARGDVVSWQLPNWIEGVVLVFALDRLGAVSNPILPIYREREVGFVVRQSGARALVVPGQVRGCDHRELADEVRRGAPDLEHVVVARARPATGQVSFADLLGRGEGRTEAATPPGPNDACALFYTSGTTAEPKGVMHTHSTLGSFLRVQGVAVGPEGGRVGILLFPLTHVGGVCAYGIGPVVHRTRAVLLDPFDPAVALDLIEREGVTSAGGPTPILQALLSSPGFAPARVRSVAVAGLGATDVPPSLVREVGERLGAFVYRSYGMTECPMATAGRRGDPPGALAGTDGRPSPGVTVRVVGESGDVLGPGREGELEIFGPQLCVGYADAGLDREAFTADGFLRSGDLAVVDADGFVRITGRRKDVILRKGETLSARAIEDELAAHPAVLEAAVVGLPDPSRGERVCACLVLRPDASGLDLEGVREFLLARGVMVQKVPEQLEILPELPRTATGKVRKGDLRGRLAAGG